MFAARFAVRHERTCQALRTARRADGRTQVHHRLVEVACACRIEEAPGKIRDLAAQLGAASFAASHFPTGNAAQHAFHVAIDNRDSFAVSDAGHRRSRVGSNARQRAEFLSPLGQVASTMLGHKPGSLVQHACAPVIAQAAPKSENLLLRREGKRNQRGKPRQKRTISLDNNSHARLLQHDLRDPDRIGIGTLPPWQIAAIAHVPGEQMSAQFSDFSGIFVELSPWAQIKAFEVPPPFLELPLTENRGSLPANESHSPFGVLSPR